MRIVVCIKEVVDASVPLEVHPSRPELAPDGLIYMPNPADLSAAALAAEWIAGLGGESIAVTVGPVRAEAVLRAALGQGVDCGLLLHDEKGAVQDPMARARALAVAIVPLAPDLVLCGTRSADTGHGIVPGALAEFLRLPQLMGVTALRLNRADRSLTALRRLERGLRDEVSCPLPTLVAVEEGIAPIAYPSLPRHIRALRMPLDRQEAVASSSSPLDRPAVETVALGPLRPRPKRLLAPSASLSASERLRQLMGGAGRKEQSTDTVEGSAADLAAAFVRFLKQQRFL